MQKLNTKIYVFALPLLALLVACSPKFTPMPGSSTGSSIGAGTTPTEPDFIPKATTRTVSMVYSKQILDNYVMCSGIGKPSFKTADVWSRKKGTISESGYAMAVTGPMLMSVATIAGEVCNQLIEQEAKVAINARRIFTGIDFTAAGTAVPQGSLSDSVRRLARSCWQRNEDDEERDMILTAVNTAMAGATTARNTGKNAALITCTAMLSSLSALEM